MSVFLVINLLHPLPSEKWVTDTDTERSKKALCQYVSSLFKGDLTLLS